MGIIRNEMVIVHHWKLEELEKLRESAILAFEKVVNNNYNIEKMVSPIMESYINSEYTFIINGECSKVNWNTSDLFHDIRMKWCEKHKNDVQNIMVINFGDDGSCRVIFDNEAETDGVEEMTREEAKKRIRECLAFYDGKGTATKIIKALEQQPSEDVGELSDGYHTFNQLYHQRAVLFACIVKQNKNKAWKSFKHSDGKYCFDSNGEWFIVGVDTPQGSYTYHYAKEYWDMFDCQELERGKEWDGHTEEDVTRLLSLPYIESEE